MKQHSDWSEVEQVALSSMNKKWISNEKQKVKKPSEPHGHNLEAVAHFKRYTDTRDPFYIYMINSNDKKPSKPSFVFKTSKLKARFALNMKRHGNHCLSKEFCYFDGKVKRCRRFVALTASMYHPVLRKLIQLATMECNGKNTSTIALFWETFNEVLKKESCDPTTTFNPYGWMTTWLEQIWRGLRKSLVQQSWIG